jgi:hypothetical protein
LRAIRQKATAKATKSLARVRTQNRRKKRPATAYNALTLHFSV